MPDYGGGLHFWKDSQEKAAGIIREIDFRDFGIGNSDTICRLFRFG